MVAHCRREVSIDALTLRRHGAGTAILCHAVAKMICLTLERKAAALEKKAVADPEEKAGAAEVKIRREANRRHYAS
jgi:hypothetical protein